MALHRAGLEVILDVVFNHTAEGGDGGPTFSFRGIDNPIYYFMSGDGRHYANYSGCGNTVNGNHPVVRDFILNCLRYWVLHMHVDGFRFDLASVLTRGRDGQLLPNPPLVEHIAEDPALRHTKIIAEAWDAAGAYQVGSFPSDRFSEWNGRFRDDVRRFWRGDAGLLSAPSPPACPAARTCTTATDRSPLKSINFITCHDGFTLADLVSYNEKRNQANGEQNRDGEKAHNLSQNCGTKAPPPTPRCAVRRRRSNATSWPPCSSSQGVPMLLGGDEFGRTQQGNNNAYCQDNELAWVDWRQARQERDLLEFTRRLIALRAAHPVLRRHRFLSGRAAAAGLPPDVTWTGPHGHAPDWANGRALACRLAGDPAASGLPEADDDLLLIFNGDPHAHRFVLPPAAPGWTLELHTQEQPPAVVGAEIVVEATSVTVLVASRP
jgi:isoamylase